jgi:biotin carboxyl carrier protein
MRLLCLIGLVVLSVSVPGLGRANDMPSEFVIGHTGQFKQGGMVVLALHEGVSVRLNGETLPRAGRHVVLGFGRNAPLTQKLAFKKNYNRHFVTLNLQARQYDIQRIDGLPPKMVTPPDEDLPRIIAQGKLKRAARAVMRRSDDFAQDFIWPVQGRISGVYGSQRFYNGEPRRPHYGIDIAAPRGTKIIAPAPGRVTLAEPDMYFEGGLIFIDHGLGVTSAYMHLDSLKVKVGDRLKQGDVIATVGSTGRSTGPHLDWRVFWKKARLDPALIATGTLSK